MKDTNKATLIQAAMLGCAVVTIVLSIRAANTERDQQETDAVTAITQGMTKIEHSVASLGDDVKNLQASVGAIQGQITNLNSTQAELKTRMDRAEKDIADNAAEIRELFKGN